MSGIVRRIDDLGRIVIPKEIRRSLKLKEGETLDISVEKDKILLKRYSNFLDIEKFLKKLVEQLGKEVSKDIIIFDNIKIVCQYSKCIDKIEGKEITEQLNNYIDSRKINQELTESIKIDNNVYNGKFIYSTLIPNGDAIGGIILYSDNEELTDIDRFVCNILQKTLIKYIEE